MINVNWDPRVGNAWVGTSDTYTYVPLQSTASINDPGITYSTTINTESPWMEWVREGVSAAGNAWSNSNIPRWWSGIPAIFNSQEQEDPAIMEDRESESAFHDFLEGTGGET